MSSGSCAFDIGLYKDEVIIPQIRLRHLNNSRPVHRILATAALKQRRVDGEYAYDTWIADTYLPENGVDGLLELHVCRMLDVQTDPLKLWLVVSYIM